MVMCRAGNIACAARASTGVVESLMHRRNNKRMLAHAQIVVGAPHRHLALAVETAMQGTRKAAADPTNVGEFAIAAFATHLPEGRVEGFEIVERVCHDHT